MARRPWGWYLMWAVGLAFVASILWSFLAQTLLPLAREGDVRGVLLHVVGFPVIIVGTGIFAYRGLTLARDIIRLMADPDVVERAYIIRDGADRTKVREARRANSAVLWATARRGLTWMGIGFAGIAVGGFIINF